MRRNWVAGGAETYLLDLGQCLTAAGYDVTYLFTQQEAPTTALAILGRTKDAGSFRHITDDAALIEGRSRSYDLFINAAAHFPIAGRARRNWLMVFAPGSGASPIWRRARRLMTASARRAADGIPIRHGFSHVRQRLRTYPPSTERGALRSYDRIIGVSQFVAGISAQRYGRRCDVVYPAVPPFGPVAAKEPLVLSIGRFSPWGNAKRHDVLIEAARSLKTSRPDIRVALVGSLSADEASQEYLASLMSLASDLPAVTFYIDATRDVVEDLLSRSLAYWHAAGFGLDPLADPDSVEQFGISVVEAMSAQAVPLVFPVGGPPEIVTHDVDGLYWNTPRSWPTSPRG